MKKYKKEEPKPDNRKITDFFRAVEKERLPTTFYGHLISDDGFNVVCFATKSVEGTGLKERILEKCDHNFTKIDAQEFEYHSRIGIFNMHEHLTDKKFEFEAAQHNVAFAEQKLNELLK